MFETRGEGSLLLRLSKIIIQIFIVMIIYFIIYFSDSLFIYVISFLDIFPLFVAYFGFAFQMGIDYVYVPGRYIILNVLFVSSY